MGRSLSFTTPAAVLLLLMLGLVMPSCMANEMLIPGTTLYTGQCLVNGAYTFCVQYDCDLVLADNGALVWHTDTKGMGTGCYVTMHYGGDLKLYGANGGLLWNNNKKPDSNKFILALQNDRNVVIYGPVVWASGTGLVVPSLQRANEMLIPGTSLYSRYCLRNGDYTLCMQFDCDLVLADNGALVWHTDTKGISTSCHITIDDSGDLKLYGGNGKLIWTNNKKPADSNKFILALQNDRNLVIYGPAVWSTGTYIGAAVAAAGDAAGNATRKIDMVVPK